MINLNQLCQCVLPDEDFCDQDHFLLEFPDANSSTGKLHLVPGVWGPPHTNLSLTNALRVCGKPDQLTLPSVIFFPYDSWH